MTLPNVPNKTPGVAFRWSFIALPAAVLAASLILTAVFYPRLPADLAYHFKSDGTPDRSLGRNQILFVMLFPQVLLTLLAAASTLGMMKLSSRFQQTQIALQPEKIVSLMGNILAMPEIVLAFFMLDVFLYNAYQIHFITIWALGVAVMIIGGIFLGVFFYRAFHSIRRTTH